MKAYIFDLDGTVANTLEDLTCAINLMLVEYSFPIFTLEEIKAKIGNGARNLVMRSLPEEVREDSAFVDKAMKTYQNFYSEHCLDKVCLYSGVEQVLRQLKTDGKQLAIITNKDNNHAKMIIDKLVPNTFDIVLGFRDDFPHKPSPESTNWVMEKLGVKKEETVFIGDSPVDIKTARNAGVLSVGVDWGFVDLKSVSELERPDVIITKAEELLLI
jgi:phosphoglycolate phosphatase